MDLAYLNGQRPADALNMTEHDIIDGHLIVTQKKTKQPLRIQIVGELAALLARTVRKAACKFRTARCWSTPTAIGLPGRRYARSSIRPATRS